MIWKCFVVSGNNFNILDELVITNKVEVAKSKTVNENLQLYMETTIIILTLSKNMVKICKTI